MKPESYLQLLARRAQLDADIAAARATERRAALEQIRRLMADYDITAAEFEPERGRHRVPRSKVVPLYLDPVTGATWSGRGKVPRWLAGHDREAYRIQSPMNTDSLSRRTHGHE